MRLLAVCGSLRATSSNAALLQAAAALAPPGVGVAFYAGLADLPAFNPDLDDAGPEPAAVAAWRAELRAAAGVLVSAPEYAHGVPGSLKNALDWVVGSGEFGGKPVGLLNAQPRATFAHAQLAEVLSTMEARLVPGACVAVPVSGRRLDAAGILADAGLAGTVRAAVAALAGAA